MLRSRLLRGATVFILFFAFLYWIAADILQTAGDEGIYLEGGRRVALGQLPYRDFFALTGPFTFWIQGSLAHISGMSLAVMRLPLILDVAFLAWAVYWLLMQYAAPWYSAITALAFLAYESRVRLLAVNHRWDSSALATAAVMAALAAERSGRRTLWIASGFLAAAAAWATPSILVVALPLLFWSGWRERRQALAFLAGGILASAGPILYLQANHALLPMIHALFWTGANYTAANRVSYGAVWLGTPGGIGIPTGWTYLFLSAVASVPAILPLLALFGWLLYWRAHKHRGDIAEIAPMVAASVALVLAAWPRWTADTLLHTLALPWFLCSLLMLRLTNARQRFWIGGLAVVLAASSLSGKIIAAWNEVPLETRVGTVRDPGDQGEFLESLERWVQPGDSLFSFPYLPSVYYFLNAHNPSRYSFLQPGMMTRDDELRALGDLRANPPLWVIYERYPANAVLSIWPGSDPALIPLTALNDYFHENYRQVDIVTGRWGTVTVLQRVGAP